MGTVVGKNGFGGKTFLKEYQGEPHPQKTSVFRPFFALLPSLQFPRNRPPKRTEGENNSPSFPTSLRVPENKSFRTRKSLEKKPNQIGEEPHIPCRDHGRMWPMTRDRLHPSPPTHGGGVGSESGGRPLGLRGTGTPIHFRFPFPFQGLPPAWATGRLPPSECAKHSAPG